MDKLGFGLGALLIGILIVFVGLCILILCVRILNLAAGKDSKKKEIAPAPVKMPEPVTPVPLAQEKSEDRDDALIAVITAAVAAVWQGEGGFQVRRVRRIQNTPAWHRAGREEQTYSRL